MINEMAMPLNNDAETSIGFLVKKQGGDYETMQKNANFTTTHATVWKNQCREWAKANLQFILLDIESEHFIFCQQLCRQFGYNYRYVYRTKESFIEFYPKVWKHSAEI